MNDIELRVGTRIRLIRDVERFPFFIAKAGMEGVITENNEFHIAARMDAPLAGAEEWDNAILWNDCNEGLEAFVDDVQLIGYAAKTWEELYIETIMLEQERDGLKTQVADLLAALWQIRRTSEPNEIANIAQAAIARAEKGEK
jgi:hypothetical protein